MLDRYKPSSFALLFSILCRSPAHVNRCRQEHACDIITIRDAGQKDVVRNKNKFNHFLFFFLARFRRYIHCISHCNAQPNLYSWNFYSSLLQLSVQLQSLAKFLLLLCWIWGKATKQLVAAVSRLLHRCLDLPTTSPVGPQGGKTIVGPIALGAEYAWLPCRRRRS